MRDSLCKQKTPHEGFVSSWWEVLSLKNEHKREVFSEESRETKLLVKGRQVGGPQGGTKMAISGRKEAIELFKIAILFQHLDKFIFCAISHLFVARFPSKASGSGNLANLLAAPECFLCICSYPRFNKAMLSPLSSSAWSIREAQLLQHDYLSNCVFRNILFVFSPRSKIRDLFETP